MKKIITITSFICINLLCFGQAKEVAGVVNASSDGIFIYNFFKPANQKRPNASGATGFRVERAVGKGPFTTIIERATPSNIYEFEKNLEEGMAQVPFPLNKDYYKPRALWLSYASCHCFDSIRHEIAFLDIQMAFSLLFKDEKVEKGKSYQYRISEVDKTGKVINAVTSTPIAYPLTSGFSKPIAYSRNEMRSSIRIRWYSLNRMPVKPTTFKIYRGNSRDAFLRKLDITPFITQKGDTMFYDIADDDVIEETYYYYTISPTNYWGVEDVYSDTAEAFTLPLGDILLPQFFKAIGDSSGNAIHLSWRVYKPSLVGTVQIWRSNSYDNGYEQIGSASSSDTGYTDFGIQPGMKHYYYLTISDRLMRQSLQSPRVFGLYATTERPLPVRRVTVSRSNNVSAVRWMSQDENITGFYVYRCQGVDGEMKLISHFIPRTSADSMLTFTDKDSLNSKYLYGYCVRQENTSYIQSNCGEMAYVQPTLKLKVAPPLGVSISKVSDGLMLFWEDMRDANPQLMGYNIYFASEKDGLFKVNKELIPSHTTTFKDTLARQGVTYKYVMECVDMSGNKSNLTDVVSYTIPPMQLTIVSGLTGIFYKDKVMLAFNPAFDKRIVKYHIYRYERNTKPVMLGEVASTASTYEDKTTENGKLYFYFMVAVDAKGNNSPKSKEVGVETN